ncbi:uncharacterized protein [Emydura macquarii macquarii]|uniref:uncharacterized protein n=1 Tax=Emydura macquarii macquarii TaxID=1129001 RepID=UPI00352AEF18
MAFIHCVCGEYGVYTHSAYPATAWPGAPKRQNQLFTFSRRVNRYEFDSSNRAIKISRVQTDDAGVYVCEVGNSNYTLKGNGTKLEVHGSGQKPENQAAADGCIYVTVPHEEEAPMALIVGLTFLLLILSLLIVCCFKVRKWFPAKESLRSRADTHTETPTQQETAEVRTQLYSNPESTTGVTQPEERHLQRQAPAIPVKDSSLNYSSVCFRKEYLEPAQRNEEPTTLYAPVKKKKSPASDAVYDQP